MNSNSSANNFIDVLIRRIQDLISDKEYENLILHLDNDILDKYFDRNKRKLNIDQAELQYIYDFVHELIDIKNFYILFSKPITKPNFSKTLKEINQIITHISSLESVLSNLDQQSKTLLSYSSNMFPTSYQISVINEDDIDSLNHDDFLSNYYNFLSYLGLIKSQLKNTLKNKESNLLANEKLFSKPTGGRQKVTNIYEDYLFAPLITLFSKYNNISSDERKSKDFKNFIIEYIDIFLNKQTNIDKETMRKYLNNYVLNNNINGIKPFTE